MSLPVGRDSTPAPLKGVARLPPVITGEALCDVETPSPTISTLTFVASVSVPAGENDIPRITDDPVHRRDHVDVRDSAGRVDIDGRVEHSVDLDGVTRARPLNATPARAGTLRMTPSR